MTREHVVRLVQMAGITMNMCMQLKGCGHDGGTGDNIDDFQMVWWTVVESTLGWLLAVLHLISTVCIWILFLMVQLAGICTLLASVILMIGGPLVWRNLRALQGFTTRNAPGLMGFRYRWFIRPSLWVSWWMLRHEITYLHARFRAAGQRGDMMVDSENVFQAIDEYLTGGQTLIGAAADLVRNEEPMEEAQDEPMAEPFGPDDDIAELAYQHARQLNGHTVDRAVTETMADEQRDREVGADGEDEDEDMDETPRGRRRRYLESSMSEVSDPEEWAEVHYGSRDQWDHERMVAFSNANQLRLRRAYQILLQRRQDAEAAANWEEASHYSRAMAEVRSLMDLA